MNNKCRISERFSHEKKGPLLEHIFKKLRETPGTYPGCSEKNPFVRANENYHYRNVYSKRMNISMTLNNFCEIPYYFPDSFHTNKTR